MKKTILFQVLALLLCFQTLGAGEPLSLKECMEWAVSNSTSVRIMHTKVGDAQLDRRDAILKTFAPEISGNSYGNFGWGRSIDPETNTYVTSTSFNNGWSVSGSITLFDGFASVNSMRIAKTAVAMGLSEEEMERDKVCLATTEAFFNVVYYRELTQILEDQVSTASASVTLALRQEELGVKGHADVVQMQALLADKEYESVCARNSMQDALLTLKDVMFWPIDEPLEIEYKPLTDSPEDQIISESEMTSTALAFVPSVAIARGRRDNALRTLKTARGQFLPTLTLGGGWSTSFYTYPGASRVVDTYSAQMKHNAGEYLQLGLSIPIFDRLRRQSQLHKSRNELSRATMEYDKTQRDVEVEVHRALQDREAAISALQQASRRASVQEEAYRLNTRKFEQGLVSAIEYNTASSDYLKALAERLNAGLKYQLKRRIVAYYNGIHYIDQEN